MADESKPSLTASEMGRKRWADVSLEERREWSRRANAKRWARKRKRAKGVSK